MRILSVVTLVSPLGEYGGPLRVAVNQARALIDLGHDVTLAGAARGYEGPPPTTLDGVPTELHAAKTLLPWIGFAGVGSPALWRWLAQHVHEYDVVHIHAARDLVTLPAAHIALSRAVPYVVQTHGMIDASARILARPFDAALTRRVLRNAQHVLYLTSPERDSLRIVAGNLHLARLINGVPEQDLKSDPLVPTVLFLARMAPRKRPTIFVEAARKVGPDYPGTRFVLVGPDEGEGPAVEAEIADTRAAGVDVVWTGAVAPEATAKVMSQASLYVLPSVDEPYGMSALEAMSVGLPVIITNSCGLADLVRTADAGDVVDESLDSLCEAMRRQLAEPPRGVAQGIRGRAAVQQHNSMGAIARQLVALYED